MAKDAQEEKQEVAKKEKIQKEDEMFSVDLQKELEAKFDELFGPME